MDFHDLKLNYDIVDICDFKEGWSADDKYILTAVNGSKYVLRLTDRSNAESKKKEVALLKSVEALDVPITHVVSHGEFADHRYYLLLDWIEAEPAFDAVPLLPINQQYELGLEAGRYLKLIHSVGTNHPLDWETYFNDKIVRKITMYQSCGVTYDRAHLLIDYLNAHRHLIKDRQVTQHHGDYHLGNMLLGDKLYIIDFERHDIGEPWEEFNRIVWCAQQAPAFAAGRIDGYFDGRVPEEFFELLLVYIASNTLSSIAWAVDFGEEQIDVMTRQADEVMDWYDNLEEIVPSFYRDYSEKLK